MGWKDEDYTDETQETLDDRTKPFQVKPLEGIDASDYETPIAPEKPPIVITNEGEGGAITIQRPGQKLEYLDSPPPPKPLDSQLSYFERWNGFKKKVLSDLKIDPQSAAKAAYNATYRGMIGNANYNELTSQQKMAIEKRAIYEARSAGSRARAHIDKEIALAKSVFDKEMALRQRKLEYDERRKDKLSDRADKQAETKISDLKILEKMIFDAGENPTDSQVQIIKQAADKLGYSYEKGVIGKTDKKYIPLTGIEWGGENKEGFALKPKTESSPPVSSLKEGIITTFKNGQSWTLSGGQQKRIK